MTRRVLVVEDDPDIGRLVTMQLAELGCEPTLVADGVSGLAEAEAGNYDLLILDLMLPRLDGLQICKRLRSAQRYTPILMLTAKSAELDRVLGLELGADDYLTKPFSLLELAARVKAILRRIDLLAAPAGDAAQERIEAGDLRLDLQRREAFVAGAAVELTAKEFELLAHFARAPGRVFTRTQLLDQVWGYSHSGYEHTVNSHINRLRNKIERDPANPAYIQTVWGVGYKFADPR
ncbi:MAG: response regulator transcription factor [Aquabacterium sp.]|jgi:DNA-binding response OmpR family regulator|nr:MAG: response regulator transcription factor [Aquabacterium sp.]TAL24285.1 MAG: response regulator transcription factor [Aquabacterium sp.]